LCFRWHTSWIITYLTYFVDKCNKFRLNINFWSLEQDHRFDLAFLTEILLYFLPSFWEYSSTTGVTYSNKIDFKFLVRSHLNSFLGTSSQKINTVSSSCVLMWLYFLCFSSNFFHCSINVFLNFLLYLKIFGIVTTNLPSFILAYQCLLFVYMISCSTTINVFLNKNCHSEVFYLARNLFFRSLAILETRDDIFGTIHARDNTI